MPPVFINRLSESVVKAGARGFESSIIHMEA